MIIYFQARGIALPVVGAPLAAGAATGLMVVLVCGALMDRVGARLVLGMILLGQVVAEVALAWAHNTLTALPAVLIYGEPPSCSPRISRLEHCQVKKRSL